MSDREDIELQRYFDGELSQRKARRIHERIERDPRAQQRLEGMRRTGDLIRTAADEAEGDARFDGLWAKVEQRIAASEPEPKGGALFGWLTGYRLLGGAVAAGLAAIVTAVVLSLSGASPVSNDCEIESLEVGAGAVSTIFKINDPGHTGETTVIWVSHEPGSGGEI